MVRERMLDIGAQLVSRTIAELYSTRPVGPDYRGYRQIVDDSGWVFERGDAHPSLAFEANVVRIPKGWRAPWSPKDALSNLVARVTYGPWDEHGSLPIEARTFDPEALSDRRFHALVGEAADRYGLRIVWRTRPGQHL